MKIHGPPGAPHQQPGVNPPPPPPQAINGPPPNGNPPLPLNPASFHINPPAVPGAASMFPGFGQGAFGQGAFGQGGFGPPQSINGHPGRPLTMPNPMVAPMWGGGPAGGVPGIAPPGGGFPAFPNLGGAVPQQPATFPLGQIPGIAHISPPLNGMPGVQGFPAQIVGATPIPPPKMPENREVSGAPVAPGMGGGLDGVLPSYMGFQFSGGQNGGPPIVNVQPAGIGGGGIDVPWQWRP